MSIFFTADTHFGHAKIIEYCNRPFKNADEMNEHLILNWNNSVRPNDIVYHLGDFAFGDAKFWRNIRERLNGRICLIRGNHDEHFGPYGPHAPFEWVKDYYEVDLGSQKAVLSHYGMRTWHHDLRGVWHLYGHSHGKLPAYGKSTDVGVDVWGFRPVSMEELSTFMTKQPIGDHPAFDNFQPPRF